MSLHKGGREVVTQAEAMAMERGTGIRHEIMAWQSDIPAKVIEHGPGFPCALCGWKLYTAEGAPWDDMKYVRREREL